MADITRDGYLDLYEYALARHFIEMKLEGFELPASLPERLLPSYEASGGGGGGGVCSSWTAMGGGGGGSGTSCSGSTAASLDIPSEGRMPPTLAGASDGGGGGLWMGSTAGSASSSASSTGAVGGLCGLRTSSLMGGTRAARV